MRARRELFFLTAVTVGATIHVSAQTTAPPNPRTTIALHEVFIRRTALLSSHIQTLKSGSNKGAGLRVAVCNKFRVNGNDCDAVLNWSVLANAKLIEIDRQAQQIIAAVRASHPHHPKGTGELLPPPSASLAQLQAQREQTVEAQTKSLLALLTPAGATALTSAILTPQQSAN
jgi:hypothetical protein